MALLHCFDTYVASDTQANATIFKVLVFIMYPISIIQARCLSRGSCIRDNRPTSAISGRLFPMG